MVSVFSKLYKVYREYEEMDAKAPKRKIPRVVFATGSLASFHVLSDGSLKVSVNDKGQKVIVDIIKQNQQKKRGKIPLNSIAFYAFWQVVTDYTENGQIVVMEKRERDDEGEPILLSDGRHYWSTFAGWSEIVSSLLKSRCFVFSLAEDEG